MEKANERSKLKDPLTEVEEKSYNSSKSATSNKDKD
jgi:hypothetical protein